MSVFDRFKPNKRTALVTHEATRDESYTLFPTRARSLKPREYQIDGINFLKNNKRAILADAPGLGKTFQSCEAAVLPALVTCPLTLVQQWAEFIVDQYPD